MTQNLNIEPETLLLTRADVNNILAWPQLIRSVRQAHIAATEGYLLTPGAVQIAFRGGSLHVKAGGLSVPDALSVKANLRPDNRPADGVVLLFSQEHERLAAVVSSTDLTTWRTAGTAALAAQALSSAGHPVIAILGAGPVGQQTLHAMDYLLNVKAFRIWSRNGVASEWMQGTRGVDAEVIISSTISDAVALADIVVTCTPSRSPLLSSSDLSPQATVIALGADSPGKQELSVDVFENALIVVDVRDTALLVGEVSHLGAAASDRINADLGDILTEKVALPRGGQRRVVFDSVGSAFVDAVVTKAIVDEAIERDLGTRFSFRA